MADSLPDLAPGFDAGKLHVRFMKKHRLDAQPSRLRIFVNIFAVIFATLVSLSLLGSYQAYAKPDIVKKIEEVVESTGLAGSYLAARVATTDNDDLAAVSFLEKSYELDPENNSIRRNLFLAYLTNGRIEDAVELSRDIKSEENNGNIIALVNGAELIRKRSWAKAIDTLSQIDGSDLDNLAAGILEAWAQYGDGKTEEGLKQIEKISGANWMNVIKLLHRGLMLAASGNDEGAVGALKKAVDMRSASRFLTETYIDAVDALARIQQRMGQVEESRATILNGLRIFPNRPSLHAMIDALDEKRPAGLLVTNSQQGAAEFFFNLGNILGRENNGPFAQIYMQLAAHLDPENPAILISLAAVFEKLEDPERANTYYEQIKDGSLYKRRALLETAINLNTMKKTNDAKAILHALVEENPSDLVPYMTLGRLLNQHEKHREAAEIFDKAIAIIKNPERRHWDYFYRRAIAFERLNEWDKAEASFKKALELDPNRATVLNYLGYSWVDKGINLAEGLDMIRKAIELRPDAGFIVDSLGWAYYRLKRFEDATVELEKAVAMLPHDPVVNDHLGDAYWQIGRKLEAKFQWQHALDAKPAAREAVKIRKKIESGMAPAGEKSTTNAKSTPAENSAQ